MCPLRLILIFLSAALAGFFVLRNLKSQPQDFHADQNADLHPINSPNSHHQSTASYNPTSKVSSAIKSGFWTLVDMASGRYLWKHLVSSSSSSKPSD